MAGLSSCLRLCTNLGSLHERAARRGSSKVGLRLSGMRGLATHETGTATRDLAQRATECELLQLFPSCAEQRSVADPSHSVAMKLDVGSCPSSLMSCIAELGT